MDPIIIKDQFNKLKDFFSKPLTFYSIFGILFSCYVLLRAFNIDPLPPLLNKIGFGSTNRVGIDINGNYIYETFALDSIHKNYFHGGYCKLEQSVGAYGVKWGLAGFRTWRKFNGKPEEKFTIPWSTDWGGIFDDKKIRFTYNIITPEGNSIKGYCEGDIICDKIGKCEKIVCKFNQLPPADPMFGTIILQRIDKENLSESDVFKIVPIKE